MKFYDFEYDGLYLSDFGFMVCTFNSGGIETVASGSQISFNTTPFRYGEKQELTSIQYDNCIEFTFQICKNICAGNMLEITFDEFRELASWLNRKSYQKFKILEDEYDSIYFESSFNISKIEADGKLYGLELNMKTNRPFALKETKTIKIKNDVINDKKNIISDSDEEGFIYPYMEVEILEDGDFSICNLVEERTTQIKNCVAHEVITFDYPMIKSSVKKHKIANDFNWIFFRIATSFKNKNNEITISSPCNIVIKYNPIVKFGF